MSTTLAKTTPPTVDQGSPEAAAAALVARGRDAMAAFAGLGQARIDEAVTALAWSLYKPENARALAEMAVADTGLGNVADKITKNTRKTFGTLRDLLRVRSTGVIEEDPARGLVVYAKPVESLVGPEDVGDRLALTCRALIVPENRGTDDLSARIQQHQPMHLPCQSDRADLISRNVRGFEE